MKKHLFLIVLMIMLVSLALAAQHDYNPSNSPAQDAYDSNTYTELGWTDIVVTQTDVITKVVVAYTWDTDSYASEGSFRIESPASTSVIIASGQFDGTYNVELHNFDGQTMNGNWKLWIQDSYGDGGHQATEITVSFHYEQAGAPGVPTNPIPANNATGVALSGTLTWDFGADTDTYDLYFGPTGNMSMVVDNQPATTGSWNYGPLSEFTNYQWQVIARNSAKAVTNGPVWSFQTLLNPISTFPWSESFDGTTFAPDGWVNVKTAGSGDPGIWDRQTSGTFPTCSPHSGAAMARYNCFNLSAGTKGELITPALAVPNGEDYRVKFWMYRDDGYTTNYDLVNVYVNNSATSSGGSLLGTINRYRGFAPVVTVNGWYEYTFAFTGTTSNRHIIFEAVSAYGNNIFIDDVTVELVPAGAQFSLNPNVTEWDFETVVINQTKTKQFTVTNTGGGTLNVSASWTGQYYRIVEDPFSASLGTGASASFTVEYAPLAAGTHTGTVTITHDGGSKAYHYIDLNGICVDPTIYSGDLPYTQNFDDITAPALPLGWTKQVNSTSTYAYVQTYIYSTPLTTPNHIYMTNSSDAAAELVLISPLIDPMLNTLRLKFWAKGEAAGYTLQVGTMDDSGSRATFTNFQTVNLTSTYTEYTVMLNSYSGSDQYLAFKHGLGGTYRSVYIDDVTIEELPAVLEPSALTVSNVGVTSVQLGWTENNTPPATQWDIVYGAVGFDPDDGTPLGVTENPYTLDNLSPETSYHWYVRSITSSKATSAWAGPGSFTTAALPETVPYIEDFESITTAGSFPAGWTRAGTRWTSQISPQDYNRYARSGNAYLTCSWSSTTTDWMFSKGIALEAAKTYDFGIWYNTCGTSGWTSFKMYIGTSASGAAMLTELAGVDGPINMTYAQLTRTGWQPPADGVYYVGLQVIATFSPWYMSFDDFSVVETPTYPVFSISPSSFDYGDVVGGTSLSQEFVITNVGAGNLFIDKDDVSVTGLDQTHFILTPLTEDISLPGGESSDPITVTFKPTTPGPKSAALQIIDNTAKYSKGTQTVPLTGNGTGAIANVLIEDFSSPGLPDGWDTFDGNEDDATWYVTTSNPNSPPYAMYISYNSTLPLDDWLFSPAIELQPGINYTLTFYYRAQSPSYYESMKVMLGTAADPDFMTIPLWDNSSFNHTSYLPVSVSFNVPAKKGTYYLGWHAYSVADQWGINVDDISVTFEEPFVPVVLSSFTAVLTAEMFVQIAWVTESETNHLGYNILRNTENDLDSAVQLNLGVISNGSSEGTQVSYSFTDTEVEVGSSYYYWLQSMDLGGSSVFYGPLTVDVNTNPDGPEIPLIPLVTKLMDAYPNPFNPSTTIRYQIKEAGDVRIEIYNTRGQKLRSFNNAKAKAGYYQVTWDGKDANGKELSSGVYIYRMISGKYTSSKKMVLTK